MDERKILDDLDSQMSRRKLLKTTGALTLAAIGSSGVLAACGSDDGVGGSDGEGEGKIAFAMNGSANDQSWEASHLRGLRAIEEAFPGVEGTFVDQVPFGKQGQQTFQKLVQDGNRLIFVTTNFDEDVGRVGGRSPDTTFMVVGGTQTTDNVGSYYVANWTVAYLLGVAAGRLTETNTLGYVASFPVSSVFGDLGGLILGARSVNPDVSVQVVKIDSWQDPPKATQAVNALVDQGADFIWHILGDTSVPQAAERRGVWSAAWSLDARKVAPKGYVSTTEMNWGPYYTDVVRSHLDGTFEPPQFPPGEILPLGRGIDLGEWGNNVPEEVQEEVDQVHQELLDGFNPFVGPLRDSKGELRVSEGEELTQNELIVLDWAFDGVNGI